MKSTLEIISLIRNPQTGVVIKVYGKQVIKNQHNLDCTVVVDLDPIDPNNQKFIFYEQLTEEIVLEWVKTKLGNQLQINDEYLQSQLNKKLNPEFISGLPWQQT